MLRVSIRRSFTTVIALLVMFVGGVASATAGTLKVTSFPTGAQVIVDGVNTGKLTPMNISLADGDHVVTVVIPGSGWNADTRTVTIAAGNNDLSVTLLPMLTVGPAGPKGDKGDKGDTGATGASGTNGMNGTSVTFVDYFSGNQFGCANGGAIYAAGSPAVQTFVCNGSNGTDAMVGATHADGPCFERLNRYVDCGNGTVTDTVTGLIWLKEWDCLGRGSWADANQEAGLLKHGDCGLTDHSTPGDWRLPSLAEWHATIAQAEALGCMGRTQGAPKLTNNAGTACYGTGVGSSFVGLTPFATDFWSSSTVAASPMTAYVVDLNGPSNPPLGLAKTNGFQAWPVRGGSR